MRKLVDGPFGPPLKEAARYATASGLLTSEVAYFLGSRSNSSSRLPVPPPLGWPWPAADPDAAFIATTAATAAPATARHLQPNTTAAGFAWKRLRISCAPTAIAIIRSVIRTPTVRSHLRKR